ncbi:MAG: peptidylprolyl isomerase [Saprospiraceae bacterium]
MKYTLYFILTFKIMLIWSCVPDNKVKETKIAVDISDTEVRRILDLQDQQDNSALYGYFRHENPSYRYLAVMAFGSIQDPKAADSLYIMLNDPILEVRSAAAFALGQSGNVKATDKLIAAFTAKDTLDINNTFNANILEAVGKLGLLSDLKSLATVKTYRSTDTLLLLGQAKAIYRMALRGISAEEGTSRMVDLLYTFGVPEEVRLYAAHYLAREKSTSLDLYKVRLTEVFGKEQNPDIRMALATAFGRSTDTDFLTALKAKSVSEQDHRVMCNIIRSISKFPYLDVKNQLLEWAKNDNVHIATVAADAILRNGIMEDVPIYTAYDTVTVPWQVRSLMNGAVLNHTALYFTKSKAAFTERIIKNIKESKSDYAKASYIEALAFDPFNYPQLISLYNTEKSSLLKIKALEGLGSILTNKNFFRAFGNGYGQVKASMLHLFLTAIQQGDPGEIATVSEILKNPELQWQEWIKDISSLELGLQKLSIPRDQEAYNALKSAIEYLKGEKFSPKFPKYNHPINWDLLATLSDSTIAAVKTTKGLIRIVLHKNLAPGSVANFIALADSNYYNGKYFHRVVPNFVVQTGCPRGDGFGGLDYTIRSEIAQINYNNQGYVGMASAGPHTEGTQWFITHSPTPHLDGKYTIFGRVVEGMDVVQKIEIGDQINEIIIVK